MFELLYLASLLKPLNVLYGGVCLFRVFGRRLYLTWGFRWRLGGL